MDEPKRPLRVILGVSVSRRPGIRRGAGRVLGVGGVYRMFVGAATQGRPYEECVVSGFAWRQRPAPEGEPLQPGAEKFKDQKDPKDEKARISDLLLLCPLGPFGPWAPCKRWAPEPGGGGAAPEELYLHAPFVRRRAVDAGHRDVVEPQIDGELAAMVDDVVHHEAAVHGDLGQGVDLVVAVAEGPGFGPDLFAVAGEGRPGRGDVLVEERQKLLGVRHCGGVVAGGEVELVGGDGRGSPARELGEVDRQAAEG